MSLADALTAIGHPGLSSSRRPVLRSRDATLLTLATLDRAGQPTWHGIWVDAKGVRPVGPAPPASLLGQSTDLDAGTRALVDLLQEAYRSYIEWLEALGTRVDALEGQPDPAPLPELGALLHALAGVRKHVGRFAILVSELDGPLGAKFPGLGPDLLPVRTEVTHLEQLAGGIAQSVRDLVAMRNAVESNNLAAAANRIGEVSNRIAALANTSNLRMLGVAYVALVLALVSVVVLIPNTAATILGIPGAAWVPGWWVDTILIVLAIVPFAVVFTRPWVRRMLQGLPTGEARSAEGLSDLPEVPAQESQAEESLLRPGPGSPP
jgi:hypothetical protein